MADGTPPRRGLRGLRLLLRLALVVALAVLLGLNGLKQAPRLAALVAPAPATTAAVASAAPVSEPASAAATPSTTPTPASSATASLGTTTGGGSGSGGTTGGGSTGGGSTGGGTVTKPSATAQPDAVITSMYADSGADCLPRASDAPGAEAPPAPEVTIHWRSTGGVGDAWFGVNTSDAKAAPYSTVHQSDSITLTFPCSEASQRYTVTVQSQSGALVSRSITVRNTGTVG